MSPEEGTRLCGVSEPVYCPQFFVRGKQCGSSQCQVCVSPHYWSVCSESSPLQHLHPSPVSAELPAAATASHSEGIFDPHCANQRCPGGTVSKISILRKCAVTASIRVARLMSQTVTIHVHRAGPMDPRNHRSKDIHRVLHRSYSHSYPQALRDYSHPRPQDRRSVAGSSGGDRLTGNPRCCGSAATSYLEPWWPGHAKAVKYTEKLTLGRRFNTSTSVLSASSLQWTTMFHVKRITSVQRSTEASCTTAAGVPFSSRHRASVRN